MGADADDFFAVDFCILAHDFISAGNCGFIGDADFLKIMRLVNFFRQGFESVIQIAEIVNVIVEVKVTAADCKLLF